MTLSIPAETYQIMKKNKEIKWTEIARQAIEKKAIELKLSKDPLRYHSLKKFAEGEDAEELFDF